MEAATQERPALLTTQEAASFFGVSERKFEELRYESWMCKPVVLGPRLTRWARADLMEAIGRMPRQAERVQPAQLRRARIDGMKAQGAAA